jgi:hypothetical protein
METNHRPIAIYTTKGDVGAILHYPYLYNLLGEWIGWVTSEREVYSVLGIYVGILTDDARIVRKPYSEKELTRKTPPVPPVQLYPPATLPLAPLMRELSYDQIDVLMDEPHLLHPTDSGEFKEDLD